MDSPDNYVHEENFFSKFTLKIWLWDNTVF